MNCYWSWIYEKGASDCIVDFGASLLCIIDKRTQNTAHIVYNLYQCVAVTMQRLMSAFEYAHSRWIQCDGPINGYK